MTRESAKANLIALGVAEPTEEQISNYLNQFGDETKGLKTQLANAEKNAQNVADLQKQLKDLQDSKLTDEEKIAKEQQEKEQRIADLETKLRNTELKSQLATNGIVGEDADKLIESLNGGSFDVALLGQIISTRETEAAKKKEEEIAKAGGNPGGGNLGGNDDNKEYDEKLVDSIVSSIGGGESNADLIGKYL